MRVHRRAGKRKILSCLKLVVSVTIASVLATGLVSTPAHAEVIDKTPYRSVHEVRYEYLNPLNTSAGYIQVQIDYGAYSGVATSGTVECVLTGAIEWSVHDSNALYQANLYNLLRNITAQRLPGPYQGLWSTQDEPWLAGQRHQMNNVTILQPCATLYSQGFQASTFWDTTAGKAVLGAIANTGYNALFIGTMLGLGLFMAQYYPTYLLATAVQTGISALAASAATFFSTMITSEMNYNTAWAAALTSACITAFTEVPYLNAWQWLKAKATSARDQAQADGSGLGAIGITSWTANVVRNAGGNVYGFFANYQGGAVNSAISTMVSTWGLSNFQGTVSQVARGIDQAELNEDTFQTAPC